MLLGPGRTAALDRVLLSAVEAGRVPGVVAVVTDKDRVIYNRAFGVMDAEGEEPMRSDAVFPIYSMTKPITSLAVMMLKDEGRLSLDDPASRYLPALADREVLVRVDRARGAVITRPPARPITIRDLLRHTSGFGYPFSSPRLVEVERYTDIRGSRFPLLHDPGERWTYGMGTLFLGRIIERISGSSLDGFLSSRIFSPLGMLDTSFDLAADKRSRLVASYRRRSGPLLVGQPPPEPWQPTIRGDGGLLSTGEDYARFLQLILGRGERAGVRLLSRESFDEMVRDQLDGMTIAKQPGADADKSRPFPLGAGRDGFGLGFQVSVGRRPGERPPGSLSWAGLKNTHFWVDLENGIGVILLLQLLPFYDEQVMELLSAFESTLYEVPIRQGEGW